MPEPSFDSSYDELLRALGKKAPGSRSYENLLRRSGKYGLEPGYEDTLRQLGKLPNLQSPQPRSMILGNASGPLLPPRGP